MSAGFQWEDGKGEPGDPRKVGVRFSWRPWLDVKASTKAQVPVWRDVEWIDIKIPGDKNVIVSKAVTDQHRHEYAPQYQAWKRSEGANAIAGTKLVDVPWIARSAVEDLANLGIHTVEQLATADAVAAERGPTIAVFVQRAKEHLASVSPRTVVAELEARVAELQAALSEAKLSKLITDPAELSAPVSAPRRRGRPSKKQTHEGVHP